MTEADVNRAKRLMETRENIEWFLQCRDLESELLKKRLASEYEHVVKDAKRTPKSEIVQIDIMHAKDFGEQDKDTLETFEFDRSVIERALTAELERIAEELKTLGVTP